MAIFHGSREKTFVIKRPTSRKWPVHFGAIHCVAKYDYANSGPPERSGPTVSMGTLVEWQFHYLKRDGDEWKGGVWTDGHCPMSFWCQVRNLAQKLGTLWIFGWKMWPAWCLLKGVDEVSQGRLILDIQNKSSKIPGNHANARQAQGLFVAENPPTIICVQVPGGGRIKMVDLANYAIEPKDYGITDDGGALCATAQAIKDYKSLCDNYDMGGLQTTAASQAWYCYRRSHMSTDIMVHPMKAVLELEQASYYGGRCECRRIGHFKEKLYHLDVNSMYTSLGVITRFPARYMSTQINPENLHAKTDVQTLMFIADVTVETSDNYIPARESVLTDPLAPPGRKSSRERVIYPVGKFRTALAMPELVVALGTGNVVDIHRVQFYTAETIMKDWSTWALAMRAIVSKSNLKHLSRCAKKIMNSLPGKWGQRMRRWVDFSQYLDDTPPSIGDTDWFQEWGRHPESNEIVPYRTIAGQTQYQDKEELSATSCPAIAATWTSMGRAYLSMFMDICGEENIYYYDTDSMIVNEAGYRKMLEGEFIDPDRSGAWKLKEVSDDVEILGIRRYRFGPRWCVAGPFGGQVTGDGDPGKWREHEGFGHQLWHRSVGDAAMIKRQARWRKEYHHGKVDSEGFVHPFFVGEDLSSEKKSVK